MTAKKEETVAIRQIRGLFEGQFEEIYQVFEVENWKMGTNNFPKDLSIMVFESMVVTAAGVSH